MQHSTHRTIGDTVSKLYIHTSVHCVTYHFFKPAYASIIPVFLPLAPEVQVLDVGIKDQTNKIRRRCAIGAAMPFAETLDTFVQRILQSSIFGLCGHSFPAFDEKFVVGYDSPYSGCALA
jgi:hypothetical protein